MRLEADVFCEGPDCECHWHAGLTRFENRTIVSFPPGWLVVTEHPHNGSPTEYSFHGHDCLMKWCAQHDPPEIIPFASEGREDG